MPEFPTASYLPTPEHRETAEREITQLVQQLSASYPGMLIAVSLCGRIGSDTDPASTTDTMGAVGFDVRDMPTPDPRLLQANLSHHIKMLYSTCNRTIFKSIPPEDRPAVFLDLVMSNLAQLLEPGGENTPIPD